MKECRKSIVLKGLLGLLMFALFSLVHTEDAKAETCIDPADSDIISADSETSEDIDWNAILAALDGQEIVDGSSILVDDRYRLECEVITDQAIALAEEEGIVSDTSITSSTSSTSSTTSSYSASCNIYVYFQGSNVNVATVTHNVTVTYYDNNLVHINSGSLSVSTHNQYWTGYAYGYTIVNTDGSYSYAYGMVELYDSYNHLYYYCGSNVSVTPGSSPSFSFSQV